MTYTHRRINRHVHARKPVHSEFEERMKPSIYKSKVALKPWNFTGCKNERWLKFIDERVSW